MKKKMINLGFERAYLMLGSDKLSELLGIERQTCNKIRRGEIALKLEYAAKIYDRTKIGWGSFKEWVDVVELEEMK